MLQARAIPWCQDFSREHSRQASPVEWWFVHNIARGHRCPGQLRVSYTRSGRRHHGRAPPDRQDPQGGGIQR